VLNHFNDFVLGLDDNAGIFVLAMVNYNLNYLHAERSVGKMYIFT
jgi:hypothetical protein